LPAIFCRRPPVCGCHITNGRYSPFFCTVPTVSEGVVGPFRRHIQMTEVSPFRQPVSNSHERALYCCM
jgi:hypothetical protein